MRLFRCQHCGQLIFFENHRCERCGHRLGYDPASAVLLALEQVDDLWSAPALPGQRFRFCANAAHDVCNWLIEADAAAALCLACRHNRTIPDLSLDENLARWRRIEAAKHRLIYSLLALRLPLEDRQENPERGLAFDILAAPAPHAPAPVIGHDNGLITLALEEADDAERERVRLAMGEPYRTLLGHFRHESGHYYWDVLVRDGGRLEEFRAVFGDERQDYAAALREHYGEGTQAAAGEDVITAYAAAHPWEDFAETWAHYLHIIDTLEMAWAFGLRVRPRIDPEGELEAALDLDPYRAPDVDALIESWLPLTFAVNSLNRAMGQPDLYPFIISPEVTRKLGFVHALIRGAGGRGGRRPRKSGHSMTMRGGGRSGVASSASTASQTRSAIAR